MADVFVINKVDTANPESVIAVRENLRAINPHAVIIEAASPLFVDDPAAIRGKRVLVIEDGPTLTHGEMAYGAGWVAARRFGAAEIVDPRPFAVGSIAATYQKYPTTGPILPAMGYGDEMIHDLEKTINGSDVDLVISATPIDLTRIIKVNKPMQRVRYELQEIGKPTLEDILREKFGKKVNCLRRVLVSGRDCRKALLFKVGKATCLLTKQRFTSGLERAAMAWSISTARSMLPAAGRMAAMAGAGAMCSWKSSQR